MSTQHEKVIYYLTKAKILVQEAKDINGDDDFILPLGANKVLADIVDALEEEIDRANSYEEYDPL